MITYTITTTRDNCWMTDTEVTSSFSYACGLFYRSTWWIKTDQKESKEDMALELLTSNFVLETHKNDDGVKYSAIMNMHSVD